MDVSRASLGATIIFGLFSVIAIVLFVLAEWFRRPALDVEIPNPKEEPGPNANHIWLHLLVSNKTPPSIFGRELAVDCIARVSFLPPSGADVEMPGQIEAHWSSQPRPTVAVVPRRRTIIERFAPWLIPTATRMNVGFREENIDVFIKFLADKNCYTADPRVVYKGHPEDLRQRSQEFDRLRLPTNECIVRVELEAANLGSRPRHDFHFRNTGRGLADYAWERTSTRRGLTGGGMTTGQRIMLVVTFLFSLLLGAAILGFDPVEFRSLSLVYRIIFGILFYAVAFFALYKALDRR